MNCMKKRIKSIKGLFGQLIHNGLPNSRSSHFIFDLSRLVGVVTRYFAHKAALNPDKSGKIRYENSLFERIKNPPYSLIKDIRECGGS